MTSILEVKLWSKTICHWKLRKSNEASQSLVMKLRNHWIQSHNLKWTELTSACEPREGVIIECPLKWQFHDARDVKFSVFKV